MSEAEPRTEIIDQKLFVIRGHHLISYVFLLKDITLFGNVFKKVNPAEHARNMREDTENIYYGRSIYPAYRYPKMAEYAQDVLGLSIKNADTNEEKMKHIFEAFLSLPDNHPTEVVEGMPDNICNACAIGKHCQLFLDPVFSAMKADRESLDLFIKVLNNLNLPQPTIAWEKAHFSDAKPQKARRVKTTIGTVRKVLKAIEPERLKLAS